MQQASEPLGLKAEHTAKVFALCNQPPSQRTREDIWFIRDRLHECSSFFRLWPSQLQQLICRLAQPRHWVQHEVASHGTKPSDLCFIFQGQAAVAVRNAPGSSQLKDIATLQPGDTFGEASLLGAHRHSAVIVVRSKEMSALAVDAQALAQAITHQQQQLQGNVPGSLRKQAGWHPQPTHKTAHQLAWPPSERPMSVEGIYRLIGENRTKTSTALNTEQQQQIRRLQQQQLQAAASAESKTVGVWLASPHELASTLSSGGNSHRAKNSTYYLKQTKQQYVVAPQHSQPMAKEQLLPRPNPDSKAPAVVEDKRAAASAAAVTPECSQQIDVDAIDASLLGDEADAHWQHLSIPRGSQQRSTDMYRARHSAILDMAVARALNQP